MKIKYPHSQTLYYIPFESFIVGPFDNFLHRNFEDVTIDPGPREMRENKGIYRENYVWHFHTKCDLAYAPSYSSISLFPTSTYPFQVKFPTFVGGTTTPIDETYQSGVAEDMTYASYCPGGTYNGLVVHKLAYRHSNDLWTIDMIRRGSTFSDSIAAFERWRMTSITMTSNIQAKITYEYRNTGLVGRCGTDLNKEIDEITFKKVWDGISQVWTAPVTRTVYYNLRKLRIVNWMSPRQVADLVSSLNEPHSLGHFILEEEAYGDLANRAAKNINRTNVNVLELLRDLERPTQMIPKLRNLRKLKTLANNYLAVHYGLLPTLSDLRKIWKAFWRKRSRLHNGFQIGRSSHKSSTVFNGITYSLEQHCKLAVDKADNGYEALVKALESVGMFPTLHNIWELIPFTFIVDWFIKVGDWLDRVDGHTRLIMLNIRYTVLSCKRMATKWIRPSQSIPVIGNLSLVGYHRWVQVRPPLPPLSLQTSTEAPDHWLEASALIIQRKK